MCCRCRRGARRDERARDEQRSALGLPEHVKLLPEAAADAEAAALVPFGKPGAFVDSRHA